MLYTQRIKATADLVNGKYSSQFQLHNATGNTVQFLAIAVDKSLKGAGVFLRDSALKVLNGDETVIDVVAMSRCSGFKKSSNGKNQFAAYEKHVLGLKDPTIHFHVSGGAEVVQIVQDYRLEDTANLGCAVMIRYSLPDRAVVPCKPVKVQSLAMDICQQLIAWGSADTADPALLLDSPLMNTIDSLGMLTLVNWLEDQRFRPDAQAAFLLCLGWRNASIG